VVGFAPALVKIPGDVFVQVFLVTLDGEVVVGVALRHHIAG